MRFLQNYPNLLVSAYQAVEGLLKPFRRWLVPGGLAERAFIPLEVITKGPIFDCRMCGQCILHSTGMTCPMTCPKTLRNGPCGGVRSDGRCEIKPEMNCIWVEAWERSARMKTYGQEIMIVQGPVNHQRKGSSAWINDLCADVERLPEGWQP
jgi:hypothetical protein